MEDRLRRITESLEEADRQLVSALNARAKAVHEYNALREEAGDEPLRIPKTATVIESARAYNTGYRGDWKHWGRCCDRAGKTWR